MKDMDTEALKQGRHGKGLQEHGRANNTRMSEFYHRKIISAKLEDLKPKR